MGADSSTISPPDTYIGYIVFLDAWAIDLECLRAGEKELQGGARADDRDLWRESILNRMQREKSSDTRCRKRQVILINLHVGAFQRLN